MAFSGIETPPRASLRRVGEILAHRHASHSTANFRRFFSQGDYFGVVNIFASRSRCVLLLASVGGCVDAVGFLILGGLFVSHMSGNSAALGAYMGQGNWEMGFPHLFAIPVFVLGLFLGYLVTVRSSSPRSLSFLLIAEAVMLLLFLLGREVMGPPLHGSSFYYLLGFPALLAMGIQNSTLKKFGDAVVHTTYVTGVLDAMCESAARAIYRQQSDGTSSHGRRALASAATWVCYIVGALFGSWALLASAVWALYPAVLVLLYVAACLHGRET